MVRRGHFAIFKTQNGPWPCHGPYIIISFQTESSDLSLKHKKWESIHACEELGLSVHSDDGELVVVTLTGEREVQVGTKQATGKMKAWYCRSCGPYSVAARGK